MDLQREWVRRRSKSFSDSEKVKETALAHLLGVRMQGASVCSRCQNVTEIDSPSKFVFSLEKKNGQSRLIHSIQAEDGSELMETTAVWKKELWIFFSKLYVSEYREDSDITEPFLNNLPKISAQHTLKTSSDRVRIARGSIKPKKMLKLSAAVLTLLPKNCM